MFPPAQSPTPSIYLSSKVRRCRKLAEKDSLIASQSTNFNKLYHRGHHIYVVSLAHFISSLCLFLFVYLSFFVFIYFSYLYIYQWLIYLSNYPSIYLRIYLSVYQSTYLPFYLSTYLLSCLRFINHWIDIS